MQTPSMAKTPLGIISLFVVVIEAALVYPVTQLDGAESLIFVLFMVLFPFFVAAAFFVVLWFKPINLYRPEAIPADLRDRYQPNVARRLAVDVEIDRLRSRLKELTMAVGVEGGAVVSSQQALVTGSRERESSAIDEIATEVAAGLPDAPSPDTLLRARQDIEAALHGRYIELADTANRLIARFRDWLDSSYGFDPLPVVPEIRIESADIQNAWLVDRVIHVGERLATDPDIVNHSYFHLVIQDASPLVDYGTSDLSAIVEGLCDYFPCSFSGRPCLGSQSAPLFGKEDGCVRWLDQVVNALDVKEPYARGVAWSGACWELRNKLGREPVDRALLSLLPRLDTLTTFEEAGRALTTQLESELGREVEQDVQRVFAAREIKLA